MKWPAVKAFMLKNLKLTLRSKADVFWIFAWPTIWLLMTAYIFLPPAVGQPTTLTIGVVNQDSSQLPVNGSMLIQILNASEYHGANLFEIKLYENKSALIEDIRRGKLDAGILIPEDFGKNLIIGQASLRIYIGMRDLQSAQIAEYTLRGFFENLNKGIALRKINESLRYIKLYALRYMPENFSIPADGNLSWMEFMRRWMLGLASPINASFTSIKPEALADRPSILGWYTFGALGMSMLYSGLMFGSLMAVEERERGTLRRILASPATSTDMLLGKTLAGMIVLGAMAFFMILLGVYLCGARIAWNPLRLEDWIAALMIPLIALLMIGLGMLLSLIARSVKSATNLSVVIGLMLAFTAGIWFPSWWLPSWMQVIGEIFPGTWAIEIARSILVYNAPLSEVALDIVKVAISTAAIYILGILAYRRVLRRYAEA